LNTKNPSAGNPTILILRIF